MPKVGLTAAAVVAEAARLADELGHERLTLAAVAQRLGVKLPSLYKHIDGLDGLRRRVAALALTELTAALSRAAVGKARGDALRAVADAYRDYAHGYPGRYATTLRAPDPNDSDHVAASDAVLRVIFAVLAGYGLHGDDAVDATRALRSALHGFVALEAAGGFRMSQDVDRSFARLVAGLDAAFSYAAYTNDT